MTVNQKVYKYPTNVQREKIVFDQSKAESAIPITQGTLSTRLFPQTL